jgi:hypothetical protein
VLAVLLESMPASEAARLAARISGAPKRTRCTGSRWNAASRIRRMERLTILRPDDWHCICATAPRSAAVIGDSARRFGRAIVMPNLNPPVRTTREALAYRERILGALPERARFEPADDALSDRTIRRPRRSPAAKESGRVPRGETVSGRRRRRIRRPA